MAGTDAVAMQVQSLGLDRESGHAVLVLEAADGRELAIAIGVSEATSIAKELEGLDLPRPLAHDLLRSVIEAYGGRLAQVEIVALRESTYYAALVLEHADGRGTRLDSRPSDAIAVAVRFGAPILVHEAVLAEAETAADPREEVDPPDPPEGHPVPPPSDREAWKKLLHEMDPKDFGKYKI